MRHLKAGKRLDVTTSHRKAMMRNLVTSLLEHGEIKTTVTRAKEMRKYFDKMIGLGKKNSLHARRQAMSFVQTKTAYKRLFDEYGPLYAERNGGYTRIFRIGHRLGDNAQMVLIQMVDFNAKVKTEEKPAKEKIQEIKQELQAEDSKQQAEGKTDSAENLSDPVVEKDKAEIKEDSADIKS